MRSMARATSSGEVIIRSSRLSCSIVGLYSARERKIVESPRLPNHGHQRHPSNVLTAAPARASRKSRPIPFARAAPAAMAARQAKTPSATCVEIRESSSSTTPEIVANEGVRTGERREGNGRPGQKVDQAFLMAPACQVLQHADRA